MNMRKLAVASLLVTCTSIAPQFALARADINVTIAPPPLREEVVPAPRHGYVWAPGYWAWDHNKYAWRTGTWMHERPHQHWVAHNWEHRGEHYYFSTGHWARD